MKIGVSRFEPNAIETVYAIQRAAYGPLYEKYHDDGLSPYLESKDAVLRKYTRDGTTGYLFFADGTAVGAVRIIIDDESKTGRVSALCVLPEYQNKGIAQKALTEIEKMHPDVRLWSLGTILEETGNCHLYEKLGYKKTGKTEAVNEKMTLVFYEKKETTGMTAEELKTIWKSEENCAYVNGWDFSHIHGRCEEAEPPWDYEAIIRSVLRDDMKLLDYDTGGGEFLLSLRHPYENTAATEGFPPNVALCKERLLPLGIDLRECDDAAKIPFADESFDIIIDRHGDFYPPEIKRLLKPGGLFITQQVGSDNDRELVEMLLPGTEKPFPHENLREQRTRFADAGFEILQEDEAFGPICFYDVGALVWFARIIVWEFPGFSVERCFDRLLQLQKTIERDGKLVGTTHRYLLVAKRPRQ